MRQPHAPPGRARRRGMSAHSLDSERIAQEPLARAVRRAGTVKTDDVRRFPEGGGGLGETVPV